MKKALIVYASKTGTTKDAAAGLAGMLGMEVDRYDCRSRAMSGRGLNGRKAEPPISQYDVVVLGTAMYMGAPMGAMKRFMTTRQKELCRKPLAYFTCGIGDEQGDGQYLRNHMPELLKKEPLLYRHLGGELRMDRMSAFARMAMKEYEKKCEVKPGINRDAMERFSKEVITLAGGVS